MNIEYAYSIEYKYAVCSMSIAIFIYIDIQYINILIYSNIEY